MAPKLSFLAIVPESGKRKRITFKAYFYCRKKRRLLAIKVSITTVNFLIHGCCPKKMCLVRLKNENSVKCLTLKKVNSKYKVVIKVRHGLRRKSLILPFKYGFLLSEICGIPLGIENHTLRREGLFITKDILAESLELTQNHQILTSNIELY